MNRTFTSLPPSLLALLEGGEEPNQQRLSRMAQLWEQCKEMTFNRIRILEHAALALGTGTLSDELRQQAAREAHKLVGSVGMFGFAEGSRLARTIKQMLEAGAPLGQTEASRLSELIVCLRRALEQPSPMSSEGEPLLETEPSFWW